VTRGRWWKGNTRNARAERATARLGVAGASFTEQPYGLVVGVVTGLPPSASVNAAAR
jgi:hypothetical protein